jgi:Fe2+ or Zn2+ uptake regulation protein
MTLDSRVDRLRAAGLRATAPRVAVLDVLDAASDHPTVGEVRTRVLDGGVFISAQAAYDACEALHRAGLARRIEPAGSAARFEARVGDNHHHLVCRACGITADVDCATGSAPCLAPSDDRGFRLDEAEVVFWGLCPACQPQPEELQAA